MADVSELAELSCIHFDSDSTVTWIIEVDQNLKDEYTDVTKKIRADRNDI